MKLLLMAGTTEGRLLAEFCETYEIPVIACVATEYGKELLKEGQYVKVHCGRMEQEEMEHLLHSEEISLVIDATHPYAAVVKVNIKKACEVLAIPYRRLVRELGDTARAAIYVESVAEAAEYVNRQQGNILVATGSKELSVFSAVKDRTRIYPRVLPNTASLEVCKELGIAAQNVIAMQGPFSLQLNIAILTEIKADYLVTKDSGSTGGFLEKIQACEALGVTPVIVGRPVIEAGETIQQLMAWLLQTTGKRQRQQIIIAGIGMGAGASMTSEVREAIRRADACIGAKRMLESIAQAHKPCFASYKSEEIKAWIEANPQYQHIVILMSGDTGFYSGARGLSEVLAEQEVRYLPGISSVSYFAAKLGISWEDIRLCTNHGRKTAFVNECRNHARVFALMGKGQEINDTCARLLQFGMRDIKVYVGERLSYEDESVFCGSLQEACEREFSDLSVMLLCRKAVQSKGLPASLKDEAFIRGRVPMTKEEIRCISIEKLRLCQDSIVYDIGAGTGSVSVEMALRVNEGTVYAIEKKSEALELILQNKLKFQVENLECIAGEAPDACHELPAATHAFIGGSSGRMEAIVTMLMEKNPDVRIVANAVTLETISELTKLTGQYESEVIQVNVARDKKLGGYHMLLAENPVMIATIWRKRDE